MTWQAKYLAGMSILMLGLVWYGFHRSQQNALAPAAVKEKNSQPRSEDAASPAPLPPFSESPFLNTSSNAKYIGSQKCMDCHADQADTYFHTSHSRSMSLAEDSPLRPASVTHQKSGYAYTSETTAGRIKHSESVFTNGEVLTDTQRDAQVDYVVGSGNFGHSFLFQLDGFYVQSPLTWYSTRDCWDMSPGYDNANQRSFRRTISAGCLFCHAGSVEIHNDNLFDLTVQETAIGCERCHGPGSLHADKYANQPVDTSPTGEIDYTIVNPAHLSRELSEAICQQCHLQGDTQVLVRGREYDAFRPGLPLEEFRQDYRLAATTSMSVVGHVEQMHLSKCYMQTESLTCSTCHDPHSSFSEEEQIARYRQACLDCHQPATCTETMLARTEKQDRCALCHMPSAPTEVPHVPFTHHRIGIHKPDESTSKNESGRELVSMLSDTGQPDADTDRCRGIAWVRFFLNAKGDPQQTLPAAWTHLNRAWKGGAQDPAVASALSTVAKEIGRISEARQWAQYTLDHEQRPSDERVAALECLAEIHYEQRNFSAAIPHYRELTQIRRDARHWFMRGLAEYSMQDSAAALKSFLMSNSINPRHPGTHTVLAQLYADQGDSEKSRFHAERAKRLEK